MEKIKVKAKDGLELSVAVFDAKEETKAVIQMIHGNKEHKERYYDFIEFLHRNGFTVIISDTRGHGESINTEYPLGYMNGVDQIIEDHMIITKYIKNRYPGKDLYLFGHSLGSMFARCYLQQHDNEIKKLVLCGTPNYVFGVGLGIMIGKITTFFSGKRGHSKILRLIVERKNDSWLSVNKANIEKFRNDPLCNFKSPNCAFLTVLRADNELHKFKKFKCTNPDLPILNVTGIDDPVTGGKKGLKDSINSLKKVGYKHIDNIVYPEMKHEILNEDKKEIVYKDILDFFLR